MAFFQVNFFSASLGFNTDVNVFVPTPNSDEVLNNKRSDYFHENVKFQVLYLLHGAYGDYTDWFRLTSIEKYATLHKIAVVMPSASNSFYQDMYLGGSYLTYLTEELPRFVEAYFPVSRKRENTFVAGLSMGGYGAIKLAFTRPDKYEACASLSGAVDIVETYKRAKNRQIEGPFRWQDIFQDPEQLEGSSADLFALMAKRKEEGCALPRIYQTVGTEDFTYPINQAAREKMEQLGMDLTYEEYPGIHDWDFWDTAIQRVLEWLPLADDSLME